MKVPAIQIAGLGRRYGSNVVLKDINLSVAQGEFFALAGVNGAGKTTLIKCLLDFTRPDTGSISVFGIPHTETRARAAVAFLPERFTPPYYLSGRDFLRYMSDLHGTQTGDTRILELVQVLDLDPGALDKPVRALSKGMAQKLGILACLASDKPLLVMDEPMSGLDPKARAFVRRHLHLLREAGKTMFFSTHLLTDVESLCDRVALLHEGGLAFVGSPAECKRRYETDDFELAYLRCVGTE